MITLSRLSENNSSIPASAAWYIADISEAKGKQELYTKQSPQKLSALREHALIESAVSSNRIEGIEVENRRIHTIVFGKSPLHDRDEEEVQGYRDALTLIHTKGDKLNVSENAIKRLHKLCRGEIWDAGKYKQKEGDIIERYQNGTERIRFKTVSVKLTEKYMDFLVVKWKEVLKEGGVHPLIAMGAFNLDFLCIHPFRDGNGRVSRLLMLLQCYHLGYEVGRYISLERLIEQNKERYYETLEESSQGWHEGKNNPWPYINFTLSILKKAYKEFQSMLEGGKEPRGAKTESVEASIAGIKGYFTIADVQRLCPSVSRETIRKVMGRLQKAGEIRCVGRGPGAKWEKR